MDAPCKIQGSIHVFRLVNNMCPGKWVHISQELFFFCHKFLEEHVMNFMDEILTEEGDSTMHDDEDNEILERTVHDNTCFNFMF